MHAVHPLSSTLPSEQSRAEAYFVPAHPQLHVHRNDSVLVNGNTLPHCYISWVDAAWLLNQQRIPWHQHC